jgi:outer membrane protein insertion porin family/translocation and assembly module TamA
MLGGLRGLSLEERPSVVFFPTAIPHFVAPTHLLWGNRISAQLRQPAFLEGRTDATLQLGYAIYPVLLAPLNPDAQVILGYHELQTAFGLERRWQAAHILAQASYNLQANYPFAYFGDLNPELQRVFISYLDLRATLDLRDDPLAPRRGFSISNGFELAGGPFGGSAADIRERPSMTMHVPITSDVTFASRVLFGFLFPRNYAADDDLLRSFPEFPPVRDLQIMYFRGFFSGGPDSNRGYGFHDIGPHGLAIYNIADPAEAITLCNPSNPNYDQRLCSTATGGLTLWEASVELRYPIAGSFGGVLFADASDVSPNRVDVRLTAPHLSTGVGIRYTTPIGPIRVDLGFRVPGAQWFGEKPAGEGPPPQPLVWNIPAALSLGIGEAY